MPQPAVERMSRVDTAWLRMDTDANLMMIVGIWLVEPAITRDALAARVADTLLKYERFRQKVVEDAMGASWVEDVDFDINDHVVAETLARDAGQTAEQALQQRVGVLAAEALDPARPLWQFHLVEDMGGEMAGTSALIVRIHHCIADGIALMSVTLAIADGGAPPPQRWWTPMRSHARSRWPAAARCRRWRRPSGPTSSAPTARWTASACAPSPSPTPAPGSGSKRSCTR